MSLRYKLVVEYDGTFFSGWHRQPQAYTLTVQGAIEAALSQICQTPLKIVGSGRTDAGVHALKQVAHVDVPEATNQKALLYGLGQKLRSKRIVILAAEEVPDTFHARYSAKKRTYMYRVINRSCPLAIEKNYAWHVAHTLKVDVMREAIHCLQGEHDFKTFQSRGCSSPVSVRTMFHTDVQKDGDLLTFFFTANAFLYHQVRNMMYALIRVGDGRDTAADFLEKFRLCSADSRTGVAPSDGLYLADVLY
ncbi:MAG: tRNA pseudouridine(38-40) synthase TruA [Alphaproteobacteria bacterium]|nr:tRNA pseudouridine(38-40) synthase TruA [Alphaproteobacteria bacterium]